MYYAFLKVALMRPMLPSDLSGYKFDRWTAATWRENVIENA